MFKGNRALNETDYFMLARDRDIARYSGRGLVCTLVMYVQASSSGLQHIARQIAESSLFQSVHNLRLQNIFGSYSWRICQPTEYTGVQSLSFRELSDLEAYITRFKIDLYTDPPFQVAVGNIDTQTNFLFFAWHHALLDAHGAEKIIEKLLNNASSPPPTIRQQKSLRKKLSLKEKILSARLAKEYIFNAARDPITTLATFPTEKNNRLFYHRVKFSAGETANSDLVCKKLGVELFRSLFYLAATTRAVTALLQAKGSKISDYHVPVPHDMRRRSDGPLIGNELSFLFYRIRAAYLSTLEECVYSLLEQAQRQVEISFPVKSLELFKILKILPVGLYNRTILKPTQNNFASFCFSDTGTSLSRFNKGTEEFRITDIVHYPPNFTPPGFSVVFSRWMNELSAMVIYDGALLSGDEVALFEAVLRKELSDHNCP